MQEIQSLGIKQPSYISPRNLLPLDMSDFSMWDNKKISAANSHIKPHSYQELMILTLEYMLSGNVSYRPMEKIEEILSSFFNSFPQKSLLKYFPAIAKNYPRFCRFECQQINSR